MEFGRNIYFNRVCDANLKFQIAVYKYVSEKMEKVFLSTSAKGDRAGVGL